jgi:hypothetical protein
MSSIEEAFRARIVELDTAAEDRVFREVIEQEPVMPAISFIRSGGAPMKRIVDSGLPSLQRANLRVEVIASSSADAEEVTSALQAGLDGWHGTIEDVDVLRCALTFQGDASFVDGDLFLKIVQQDYELIYR